MTERQGRSRGPVAVAAGLLAGLLISGFTVWNASSAAFSGTTRNDDNEWHAISVALDDNDASDTRVMFNETMLTPGQQTSKCIVVSYTGDAPIPVSESVKLYGEAASVAATPNLSQYLTLEIQIADYDPGQLDTVFGCAGFDPVGGIGASTIYSAQTLYTFQSTETNYGNGVDSGWRPSVGESRMFKFTTTMSASNTANGLDIDTIPFIWEVQG